MVVGRRFSWIMLVGFLIVVAIGGTAWRARHADTSRWSTDPGRDLLADAVQKRKSGVATVLSGTVEKVFAVNDKEPGIQRFVLRLSPDLTVAVRHKAQPGERVPLATGDRVRVRGVFDWSADGGIIRVKRDDQSGDAVAGWILHRARLYQ